MLEPWQKCPCDPAKPALGGDNERVQRFGKQLKFDGEHIADCVDEDTAQIIALALCYIGLSSGDFPPEVRTAMEKFYA